MITMSIKTNKAEKKMQILRERSNFFALLSKVRHLNLTVYNPEPCRNYLISHTC